MRGLLMFIGLVMVAYDFFFVLPGQESKTFHTVGFILGLMVLSL
jgi:hypothetical protein